MEYDTVNWILEAGGEGISRKTGKIQIKRKYLVTSNVPIPVS